jgi:ABC-type transport system involved in cytochrome c biogenesis ATPase subunit
MVAGMPMSSPAYPILQIEQLGFAYPGEPPLLRGWTTNIGAGLTQLLGDTGSGKSTVLRLLAGDLVGALAGDGQLTLTGVALAHDASAYRRHVFYVDPATRAYDQISGRACTDQLRQDDPGFDAARWQALVDSFNLAEHIDKPMYMLSTGSKRKVWLATWPSAAAARWWWPAASRSRVCRWQRRCSCPWHPDQAAASAVGGCFLALRWLRLLNLERAPDVHRRQAELQGHQRRRMGMQAPRHPDHIARDEHPETPAALVALLRGNEPRCHDGEGHRGPLKQIEIVQRLSP